MTTQLIPLKDLHVSPLNMRAEKKPPSLKRMAVIAANILPTVREKGILTDLIVRPQCGWFRNPRRTAALLCGARHRG